MKWPCRLEGGPYDGDSGSWTAKETLPDKLWAFRCPDCRDIHWSVQWVKVGEPYNYDRMEDVESVGNVAVYVHADVDLSDLPTIHACELTPTA